MIAHHRRKDHPMMVEAAFRQALAMRLRIKGNSYADIARKLGMLDPDGNPLTGAAHNLVTMGVKSVRLESAEEMRDLELTRYDSLLRIAWLGYERAHKKKDYKSLASILNSITRLSDRRAKLMGLDAPVKYDLLMSEARAMAEKLGVTEQEFMAECETVAGAAWGK